MALTSPGVEVTVIDQSQYLPAPTGSVPFVLLATAQNKANPTGTGVAQATTAANANKLFQVTSQRDLVTLYGTPFFYTTTNGTPIQGYELNEYGLLAAYSLLGVTNRCYVLRADIDLASLVGQTGRPTGDPADGTYWLDTTSSTWGIYEFNSTTGAYTLKQPLVLNDAAYISGDLPLASLGNIGDYAVNALQMMDEPSMDSAGQFFYKGASNTWIKVGSADWMAEWPAIQGSNSNPSLTAGDTFNINFNGDFTVSIAVPAGPNDDVAGVANAINTKGYGGLSAAVVDGKLCIYSTQNAISNSAANYITISAGSGTVLTNLGITAKTYYQPALFYGSSAQQPLWQAGQSQPRPTGDRKSTRLNSSH